MSHEPICWTPRARRLGNWLLALGFVAGFYVAAIVANFLGNVVAQVLKVWVG